MAVYHALRICSGASHDAVFVAPTHTALLGVHSPPPPTHRRRRNAGQLRVTLRGQLIQERLPTDTEWPPQEAAEQLAERLGDLAELDVEVGKIEPAPTGAIP